VGAVWQVAEYISKWAIPLVLFGVPLFGAIRGVKVYETFTDGAKEAFETAVKLIPFLVGMLVAIAVFKESGALNYVLAPVKPVLAALGVPPDVVPLGLMRPISGSAALGMLGGILKTSGPDSLVGRIASTIVGSTETTFYIIAVYFGSVGVREVRHSLLVGLAADFIGFFTAVAVCNLLF
jgi:spore maturation protein B